MNTEFKMLLAARARGKCECCGRLLGDLGEADHFMGRARAEETEFYVWILHPECHRAKTDNRPNAAHWLLAFIRHCGRYAFQRNGYVVAAELAQQKLEWLRAKGTSGEAA